MPTGGGGFDFIPGRVYLTSNRIVTLRSFTIAVAADAFWTPFEYARLSPFNIVFGRPDGSTVRVGPIDGLYWTT